MIQRTRSLGWSIALMAFALGACGDGENVTSQGQDPSTDEPATLTGDEKLASSFTLPDRERHEFQVDSLTLYVQQESDALMCIGLLLPAEKGATAKACRPPAEWDSYTSLYAVDSDGRPYVVGAVTPEIDEVAITLGGKEVTIPTSPSEVTDTVRFFASEVPSPMEQRVEGRTGGRPVLVFENEGVAANDPESG